MPVVEFAPEVQSVSIVRCIAARLQCPALQKRALRLRSKDAPQMYVSLRSSSWTGN